MNCLNESRPHSAQTRGEPIHLSDMTPNVEPRAYWVRLPNGTEYGPGSITLMRQWAAEGRVPRAASLITRDGSPPVPVMDLPEVREVLEGRVDPSDLAPRQDDNVFASIVPYKNPFALWGYYLGIFALIPGAGLLLGPAAILLGFIGLRVAKRHPGTRGTSHSWGAMLLGILASLLNIGGIVALVIAKINKWF